MKLLPVFLTLLSGAAPLMGANLLPDASFELGGIDYSRLRFFDGNPTHARNIPPVEDKTTFVHGSQSLRFDSAGGASYSNLRTPEFELDPSKRHTFSFYAKANGKASVRLMLMSLVKYPDGRPGRSWDNQKFIPFQLTPEWKRYTVSFSPKAAHHRFFTADLLWKNEPGVAVWFDALQLEEGGVAGTFSPRDQVEFALSGERHLRIDGEKKIVYQLSAVSYGDRTETFPVELMEKDSYFGQEFPLKKLKLEVPAGKRISVPFEVQGARYGVYQVDGVVRMAGKTVRLWPFTYAVSGRYEAKEVDVQKDFVLGMEESFGRNYPDLNGGKGYLQLFEKETFDDFLRVKSNGGTRLFRVGNGTRYFQWSTVETAPGKFDFSQADYYVDAVRKMQGEILGIVGNLMVERSIPEWVLKRSPAPKKSLNFNLAAVLPNLDDFRGYIRALAKHYKGRIFYWEIFNEPNLNVTAAEYLPYLKAAHEEFRKIDPKVRLVGPCVTGDLGGDMGKFLKDFGKIGGFAYCDVVSFHPYSSPAEDSPYPANKAVADIRKIMKNNHADMPLWNSELYYLPTWKKGGPRDGVDSCRGDASDLARRLLLDIGEGVNQATLLPDSFSYRQDRHPHYDYFRERVFSRRSPSDIYVAGNAFARIWEGAVPFEKLKTPRFVTVYVYGLKNGGSAAAIWNYSEDRRFTFHPSDSKAFTVYDLFGNRILPQPEYAVTRNPLYLLSGKNPGELSAMLKSSAIVGQYPLEIVSARYVGSGNTPAIAVTIQNLTGERLQPKVRLLPLKGMEPAKHGSQSAQLLPDGTVTMVFPIRLTSAEAGSLREVELMVFDGKNTRKCRIPIIPADFLRYGEKKSIGNGDFRGTFHAESTPAGFQLFINVRDSKRGARSEAPWEDDCIELFFDTNPLMRPEYQQYTDAVFRLFLRPATAEKPAKLDKMGSVDLSLIRWHIIDVPGGYEASVTIPWKLLRNAPNQPVVFDLAIDNAASGGRKREQISWSSKEDIHLRRHGFGIVYLPENFKR